MLEFWLILLVFAVLAIHLKNKYASAHPLPPQHPGAWPIIGHKEMLLGDGRKIWSLLKDASYYCLKKGGIITCRLGLDNYYFITDPDDATIVANTCFSKKHYMYNFLEGFVGQGLVVIPDVNKWKHHRKVLNPAFNRKNVHSFISIFNCQSRKMVDKMEKICGTEPVDLKMYLKENTMETSLTTMFGNKFEKKGQPYYKYSEAGEKILQIIMTRFMKIWLHINWIYKVMGYQKQMELLKAELYEIGERALNIKKANDGSLSSLKLDDRCKTLLELFLQSPDINTLSDEDIKAEVNTMIGASYDTTSNQILFTMFYIASYPEVQERIYQEVLEFIGKDRDIEKEDLPNLKYTEAVIKETLRVLPTTPVVVRYVDRELKLKNYTLRPGMYCLLSLYGINHHPDWVDPHQFRPKRWLHPETLPANSNTFAAFSLGKRNCIGKYYAMTTLIVLVAHVVRAFQLTAASDNIRCSFEIMLTSAGGSEISLRRRV